MNQKGLPINKHGFFETDDSFLLINQHTNPLIGLVCAHHI